MASKTIIFDMDGTLVDTGGVITKTINYVRRNIGLEEMEKTYLLENVNNPNINSAQFFYGTQHFTEEQTKLFEEYYHQHCISDIEIYEGINEMLNDLKGNYNLAVATNSFDVFAYKILNHLSIDRHFDFIVGANNVEKPKPHPEMLYSVMEKFDGLDRKKDFIFIGDSHKDRLSAENAEIDYLMVGWGFTEHENVINTVEDLKVKLLNF